MLNEGFFLDFLYLHDAPSMSEEALREAAVMWRKSKTCGASAEGQTQMWKAYCEVLNLELREVLLNEPHAARSLTASVAYFVNQILSVGEQLGSGNALGHGRMLFSFEFPAQPLSMQQNEDDVPNERRERWPFARALKARRPSLTRAAGQGALQLLREAARTARPWHGRAGQPAGAARSGGHRPGQQAHSPAQRGLPGTGSKRRPLLENSAAPACCRCRC